MALRNETPQSLMGSIQGEVADEASPMLQFLTDHARLIVLGVVLFIIAIIGYWFYSSHRQDQVNQQRMEFARLVAGKEGQARIAALEEYLRMAPDALRTQAWFTIAETAHQLNDRDKAFEAWEQIAFLDDNMKVTATLAMAQIRADQGDTDQSLAILQAISGGLRPADAVLVNSRIVILAENAGDIPQAISACNAVLDNVSQEGDRMFWQQKLLDLEKRDPAPVPQREQGEEYPDRTAE